MALSFTESSRLGPFRIITQLGEGGFAPVYLAAEEYGGVELRIVALKVFDAASLAGENAFDQVLGEARALSRVEHPNIVRFFQILEDRSKGIVGLAMEHVRGEPLSRRLDAGSVLAIPDALAIGATLAVALSAVHAAGLVHRDVKPDNVIETNGTVKLIDFGIATRGVGRVAAPSPSPSPSPSPAPSPAHPADAEDRTLALAPQRVTMQIVRAPGFANESPYLAETVTLEDETGNLVAGTMGYIDPACLGKGAPPDASSDLYALGAMLYECLAGFVPAAPGPNSAIIRSAIALGIQRPAALREVAPHIPEDVAALIDSLVDPDRTRRPRHADAVASELARLRRGALGRRRRLPEDGPFRGLDAFDERHRDVFFGRSSEIALALDALRTRGLVALVGPSGSGKSSLARAGVLPAIVEGELGGWPKTYASIVLHPSADPRPALGVVTNLATTPEECVRALAKRVEETGVGVVILVDALEELVTLDNTTPSRAAQSTWLAEFIATLGRSPVLGIRAIVTARRDFLDALLGVPSLGPVIARSVELISPLSSRAFGEALEERLAAYGYALEDASMRDELARELASAPEAMPLFEFALSRLWDEADHARRLLGRAALERIGGIGGALETHAEQTLRTLIAQQSPRAEEAAKAVFLALTTTKGTRTRHTTEELIAITKIDRMLLTSTVAALEKARLLVSEEGQQLTVAHEALLRQWPRLREWIARAQQRRELVEEVEQSAIRWEKQKRDRALLIRGRVLRDANDVKSDLSPAAMTFVAQSSRAEVRNVTGVAVLVSLVGIGLVVLFVLYRVVEADARKKELDAEEFAAKLKTAQETPESERARALKQLVEEKYACDKKLAQCTAGVELGDAAVDDRD